MKELSHQRVIKVKISLNQIFKYYDENFPGFGGDKRYEVGLLMERGLGSL